MRFEWDDEKAVANLAKHGVSFGEATEVFYDPKALEGLRRGPLSGRCAVLHHRTFQPPNALRRLRRAAERRGEHHLRAEGS